MLVVYCRALPKCTSTVRRFADKVLNHRSTKVQMLDKEFPKDHPTVMSHDVLYRFGPFLLDPSERMLTRGQESVSLTPKAFDTLCVLLENSGSLITKDQLLDKVWPETYVEEKTLAQNIFTLRKALGTTAAGGNYIETVPKQGYRFSADVLKISRTSREFVSRTTTDSGTPKSFNPPAVRGRHAKILLVSALLVPALGGLLFVSKFGASRFSTHKNSFSKVSFTKLTNSGDVGPMALSRDGKYVVYAATGLGQQRLVLRQTGSTSLIEIIPADKVNYIGVSFSPDGNTIYYVVLHHGSGLGVVYRIPVLGGTPVKIIEDVDSPVAVSPDGKQLAFIRNILGKNERHLVTVSAEGGEERVLASTTGEPGFGFFTPSWSPDQELIAVCTGGPSSAANGIALVDTQTGSIRPFGKSEWRFVGHLAWLPNGRELLLTGAAAADPTLSDQIWILSYPSGDARRITNDVNGHLGLGVADDQSTIASVVSSRTGAFWILGAEDPNSAKQVTRNSGDWKAQVLGLSWTPDNRLIYSSQASGNPELWTMQPDGSQQRQLTFDGGPNMAPVATRDGKYIVYSSQRGGERVVARIDSGSSNAKDLVKANAIGLSVTPDSLWIVYSAVRDERPTLFKLSIEGGEPIALSQAAASFPAVSPDGKFVACYVLTTDRRRRLSIISFATGKIVKEFDVYFDYNLPIRWTPDSKALSYVVSRNGVCNIWRQAIKGGTPEQITTWDSDLIFRFDWSNDGRLAVERGVFTNDVVLIRAEGQ